MRRIPYRSKSQTKDTVVEDPQYNETVRANSYIGKKGYTIPKSILSNVDLESLKKDLFVKPEILGNRFGAVPGGDKDSAFPVYRENEKKIYLPRFFGISRYGLPDRSEIQSGKDIEIPFVKPLRDYQDKIVDIYMKYVDSPICKNPNSDAVDISLQGNGGILEVPCGRGKTVMALKIISLLRKKTLIIVHKEFLMNQWIERAAEFVPSARIGRIQGSVVDIHNKDIVIGMVQSLYDKDYPPTVFEEFGLTVVDEVHRICSEQFSRTLFKTITPYMLGISATVDRKDKLTKVLHMFMGDKIYSEKRENDDAVCVRTLEYKSNDSEFNDVELDFRGSPKYSVMISKLCEYGPRSDFIVRILGDLIEENPENQIMVLCHNRSLLAYLYQAIRHKSIATAGYYVGGMKQTSLQETEKKQIVLATYAMAAEALDIKTLSTLVMATPKTDITQSVGRILRMKHENPIIVDIVDTHELFQNQWIQRRRFYKKCNYRIRWMESENYKGFHLDWNTDTTWKRIYEPRDNTGESCPGEENEHLTPCGGKLLINIEGLTFD
jgi:superfamily II DNA or RNA helicase